MNGCQLHHVPPGHREWQQFVHQETVEPDALQGLVNYLSGAGYRIKYSQHPVSDNWAPTLYRVTGTRWVCTCIASPPSGPDDDTGGPPEPPDPADDLLERVADAFGPDASVLLVLRQDLDQLDCNPPTPKNRVGHLLR